MCTIHGFAASIESIPTETFFSYPRRFYNGTAMHTYRVIMRARLNEEARQSVVQEVERNSPSRTDDPSNVAAEYDTCFLL